MLLVFTVLIFLFLEASAFLPQHYEGLSAGEKQDILWEQISRDPYSNDDLPKSNPNIFSRLNLLFAPFLKKSFTHTSDEIPGTRQKLIHTYGSVAKIDFRVTSNSSFTGIFQSGGIGFARLSLANQDSSSFIPGMALKILLDGQPSVNFHVMNSLEGQGTNKNFFERRFRNIIPDPTSVSLRILAKSFALANWLLPGGAENRPESETNMPVYEHAAVDSSGIPVSKVYAPYVAVFTPNPEIAWSPDTTDDLRVNLARIPRGTVLYTVAVQRGLRTEEEVIGEIVTGSPFVASRYGDEILFFQHSRKRWRP